MRLQLRKSGVSSVLRFPYLGSSATVHVGGNYLSGTNGIHRKDMLRIEFFLRIAFIVTAIPTPTIILKDYPPGIPVSSLAN